MAHYSNFKLFGLDICLTGNCSEEKIKKICGPLAMAAMAGTNNPAVYAAAYQECYNEEKEKTENRKDAATSILDELLGLFKKKDTAPPDGGGGGGGLPPDTVLGMPPAAGYTVMAVGATLLGILIYKMVKM